MKNMGTIILTEYLQGNDGFLLDLVIKGPDLIVITQKLVT